MPVISSGFEIRVSDKNHLIRVELLGKVCSDVCLLDLFFSYYLKRTRISFLATWLGIRSVWNPGPPGEFASLDPTVTWNCAQKFRQHQPNSDSEWDGRTSSKKKEMGENETQLKFLMSTRNLARSPKKIGHVQVQHLWILNCLEHRQIASRFKSSFIYSLGICWMDESKEKLRPVWFAHVKV
jgi:hypothetical protein